MPVWPLAWQCPLGQNTVVGSMTLLLAVRGNIATRSMSSPPFALQLHRTTIWCGATMGSSFIKYPDFRAADEVLKRHTAAFTDFTETAVGEALRENSRVLGVLRAILGMTPPEWAELARTEGMSDITQGAARGLDRACREIPEYVGIREQRYQARLARSGGIEQRPMGRPKSLERI